MKNTYIAKRRKVGGFTLLELLVVVGILAIIAGAIITAYDGFQRRAALQTASNTVASMTNTIRTFVATNNDQLPDNCESLITATPTAPDLTNGVASATDVTVVGLNSFLDADLASKLAVQTLTAAQIASLTEAGMTEVRYIDNLGDVATGTAIATAFGPTTDGLDGRTAMQGIYAAPDADNPRYNGLGYEVPISAAGVQFAVWGSRDPAETDPTAAGGSAFENTTVGADPTDVLVAFGIGTQSTVVGGDSQGGNVAKLGTAPFYGAVDQNEYNHYIMLVNVAPERAQFVAIVDSVGNTIDDGVQEN